ncbi:hypothetical protein ACPPVT_21165 [Angustibacter sp. McL0619]|uniref:hypothetical protein n=1 Tax=Angustibacter sp. McL0619 TaxID=3415676 RepID=UPI003CF43DC0
MGGLPAVRQLVFLTDDLPSTLAAARRELGLNSGVKDEEGMAELGFVHEVLTIENTFLEFTAPLGPDTMPARLLARRGDLGYMVVLQVADIEQTKQRAADLGLEPVMETLYEGHTITQWHPKDFGTLAELDQIRPADTWHMAPAIFEGGSTEVVQDVSAIEVAVADPAEMAARWAQVLDVTVADDGTSLELSGVSVRFVPADGAVGLVAVELPASDPGKAGRTSRLSGVDFRLV